ncbi:Transmembrane protease, serine 6 [Acromyrmex echinatior]|uniref:Phenoloxidase-activating factor 2 n=2 Tax=Acromyrmex echinatior TaxID=103372 RepID=F4W914_ACREC|nr:Transmembrane protease, serine 6 [Acromyrmex echinatior]
MSRLYVLVAVVAMTINVTTTSERVKHRHNQIEKPIMIRKNKGFSRNQDVIPFTESSSVFFLHLLKCKPRYQKLDRIFSTTPASVRDCICVPFYLCDRNRTIITDGTGIIDPRFATNRRCGDLEICCYLPNVTNTAMIPLQVTSSINVSPMTPPATSRTAPSTMPSITFPTMPPSTSTPTIPITAPTIPTSATSPTTVLPNCICVMISLCDPNGIVSISGEGVINPRYGLCPDNLVCCRILANMTQPMTSSSTTIAIISLSSATLTRISSTITMISPSQMQLCFICDNVILCFICMIVITSGGGAMIDPRVSQILSDGNICTTPNIPSCLNTSSAAPITDLGQLKNPGTSQECYCVKTWLCFEGNAISPDGLGIIDSRFTLCSSADQVCCRLAGINHQGLQSASSSSAVANGSSNRPVSQITCGIQNNSYAPSQPFSPDSGKTYFAEFPWMVVLLLKSTTGGPYIFHCGASIISNRAILTAAHCVANQKPEHLIAHFGQWNIGNNIQPLPIQEVKIVAIAIHPSYYNDGLFHDVAILVLEKPITYSANVLPICLPEQGKVFLAGTRCYGLGWGSNSFGPEGQYQAELRKVNLPIINQEDCQTRLRSTKLGQYFQLHGSFICAGGEANKDTCRGDGGGPLVCQTATGQFFQAGIVSWGIGCGASNVPAVYASVSQHRQWIDQQFATYGV